MAIQVFCFSVNWDRDFERIEMTVAVYVGTFDPFTNGHKDIVDRAARIFDQVIVGVGHSQAKGEMHFSPEDRCRMVQDSCGDSIAVKPFHGLAVDFAREHGAHVLVRGLRTEADYVYEMQMAMMNRSLSSGLETVFIPSRQDLTHISSSLVREVAALGADISGLVPKPVAAAIIRDRPT